QQVESGRRAFSSLPVSRPLTKGWFVSDIVEREAPPLEAVREIRKVDGREALWMFSGAQISRAPLGRYGHRVCLKQAVGPPKSEDNPVLSLDYKVPSSSFTKDGRQCAYVWITGHLKDEWTTNNDWHPNIPIEKFVPQWRLKYNLGVPVKDSFREQPGVFQSGPVLDKWQTCRINVIEDLKKAYPEKDVSKVDSIVITLGVWNLGVAKKLAQRERVGVYWSNIKWTADGETRKGTSPGFDLLTASQIADLQRDRRK
ncbi:hypothetical protein ACFL1X_06190, partial [Candidatus Hydrogenedentota bacterium]